MGKRITLVGFLGGVLLLFQGSVCQAGLFEKSMEGNVVSVQSNMITITPNPDASQAVMGAVSFQVGHETDFKDIDSLTELGEGDRVKVRYKEEAGLKVATEIDKVDDRGVISQEQLKPAQPNLDQPIQNESPTRY